MKGYILTIGISIMILVLATAASAYTYSPHHGVQKVYGVFPNTDAWYVRSNQHTPYGEPGFVLPNPVFHTTNMGISSWHGRGLPGYGVPVNNVRGLSGARGLPNSYISMRSHLANPGYDPRFGFTAHAYGGLGIHHVSQPLLYPGVYKAFSIS